MAARILVIEDNAANLELARYILAAAGHEVLVAIDGLSGLDLAVAEKPDLIVTDLQMPGMDGFALLTALKSQAATRALPVVALTAFSMPGDAQRVLQHGFDGYMSKPIEPEAFVAQVTAYLRGSQGRPG